MIRNNYTFASPCPPPLGLYSAPQNVTGGGEGRTGWIGKEGREGNGKEGERERKKEGGEEEMTLWPTERLLQEDISYKIC